MISCKLVSPISCKQPLILASWVLLTYWNTLYCPSGENKTTDPRSGHLPMRPDLAGPYTP